jgi:hypothetical protein
MFPTISMISFISFLAKYLEALSIVRWVLVELATLVQLIHF